MTLADASRTKWLIPQYRSD